MPLGTSVSYRTEQSSIYWYDTKLKTLIYIIATNLYNH